MSEINEILDLNINDDGEKHLVPAEKGKRFGNYIIDTIAFMLIYVSILLIAQAFSETVADWVLFLEGNTILDRVITAVFMVIYYFILEFFLKGKSIGKYITKTRAVTIDGEVPEAETIFLRSLSRIVPFEGFSFLGDRKDGWHDRWSDTMVIDEKLSRL